MSWLLKKKHVMEGSPWRLALAIDPKAWENSVSMVTGYVSAILDPPIFLWSSHSNLSLSLLDASTGQKTKVKGQEDWTLGLKELSEPLCFHRAFSPMIFRGSSLFFLTFFLWLLSGLFTNGQYSDVSPACCRDPLLDLGSSAHSPG